MVGSQSEDLKSNGRVFGKQRGAQVPSFGWFCWVQQHEQSPRRLQSQNRLTVPVVQIRAHFDVSFCLPSYLLLKLSTDQYLSTFLLVAVMYSCDFWVTKNIAGRHLAALRWYTKLDQNNQEKWCFESSRVRVPSSCNALVFWMGQFVAILFWIIITLINVVTLSTFWVFLAIYCCVLLVCNFVFFLECKGEHQERVNTLTRRFGVQFFQLNEQKP